VKDFLKHLLSAWTWRMAWRDSRTNRGRLLLFSSSIVLGVAALAASGSLGKNLERAVDEQAKTLLGADLALSSRQPFSGAEEQLLTSLGGRQAREISFSSMIYFPNGGGARLVQARALGGPFPFYGRLETEPAAAAEQFRLGQGALVEENLLIQFGAKVGDNIRLGKLTLPVIGVLKKVPGESAAMAVIAPRVYLPMSGLAQTGLLNGGGLARYRVFFQFPPGVDAGKMVAANQARLDHFRLGVETVETHKRDLGRAIDNQYHFLNLCCLIPLLLSGIGVAAAMHVHVKQKLGTVAVLRCLGGSIGQTFAIYAGQGMALGLIGALAGSALGMAVPAMLPGAMEDFIPFTFQYQTAWLAVGVAAGVGFVLCLLFALLPLLEVRRVPPLAALRRAYESTKARRDPLRWVIGGCLAAGVVAFALGQERDWRIALGFCVGLAAAFAVLAGTAKALVFLTRRFLSPTLPFTLRQGLANLHRPNNRTMLLLLSLGLGVFLIVTIQMLQHTLATELIVSGGTKQPNAVLFDIQPGQKKAVAELVRSMHLPVLDELPIVTMRLSSIKGRSIESLLADKQSHIPSWVLRREYRSTYTDHLRDTEKVIAGRWIGQAANSTNAAPISVEKDIARDLQVGLGDEIVFDVQGAPVTGRVASLREVNWRRVQPNFFVLFPPGVLEGAPHMNVLVTRVASSAQSALLQRAVVRDFPNVSVIDLTLILQTLDAILGKVSFVIQFMALFIVLTGILVLAGALVSGHFQRVQETVLLRTLGASRRQIHRILAVEYLSLGLLAAATGSLLALAAVWALAAFVFHVHFVPMAAPLLCAWVATPALTAGLGLLMSRGILNQPPLAALRNEEG
jgi:putative ABC transport system permease protein